MESESSQNPSQLSSSSTPPTNPIESFIGRFVTLISNYDLRYEGVLCYLNLQDSTLALQNVICYGTEERTKNGFLIHPFNLVYDYILFSGTDIKEILVKPRTSDTQCGYNGGYYACLAREEATISKPCHGDTKPPLPLMVSSAFNPNGAKIRQKFPLIYNENLINPQASMTDSNAYSVMGSVNDGFYSSLNPFAQPQFPGSYYYDAFAYNSMLNQAHINAVSPPNPFQAHILQQSSSIINGRVDFQAKNFKQYELWGPTENKEEESAKPIGRPCNPLGPIARPVKHTEEISNSLQRRLESQPQPYNFTIGYNTLF